jgi:maleylpyruvate isomerase
MVVHPVQLSSSPVDVRELDRAVTGCAGAHQRLLAGLAELTDDDARRPSLLPGWTVGHVLTHLARNADGNVRMLDAANRGEVVAMYEGGMDGRAADIEAGAGRPAATLVADVRATIYRLEQQWAAMTAAGWEGEGIGATGRVPIAEVPFRRWREVEVHHADLGLGFGPQDWSRDYVRLELHRMTMLWASRRPMGMTQLPAEVIALAPHDRLAWLLGRLHVDGIADAGIYG